MLSGINFTKLCFLLDKTFLQFLLFTNCTIFFFYFCLPALQNPWQTFVSWPFTYTSISAKTDITDSFNVSSETGSGMPFRITLFQQLYCAKALCSDLYFAQWLSSCSNFYLNFSLPFWRFLRRISFRFKLLSFREFILLGILFSISFICESWFILTTSCCFSS